MGIPVMAAARLQRWAVILTGYTYDIEYIRSEKNCADALSRLPISVENSEIPSEVKVASYVNFVEEFMPVTHDDVRRETSKDSILGRVLLYVNSSWPPTCPTEEIKHFFDRRNELYSERGCLMWGYRLIVPHSLRTLVLKQIHTGHLGIVKCKIVARSYVWWPGIDADVESMCRACDTCALEADAPPRSPPHPWPYSAQPWGRLHIDFLGPLMGKTYFVIIDSGSKWIEIFDMAQTNASNVIRKLRETFARFGIPLEIVSDQGPPFTSVEFRDFLSRNGIRQAFSPVYHPSSNGAAENAVKLCKRAIKKALRDKVDIEAALQTYLLVYRNSIHGSTGETPARLLQNRPLRSRMDLLRSDRAIENNVNKAQSRQVKNAIGGNIIREFNRGEDIWARGYGTQDKWVRGTVIDREGSRAYVLDRGNGRLIKRHTDQMKRQSRLSDVTLPIDQGKELESSVGSGDEVPQQASSCGHDLASPETITTEQVVEPPPPPPVPPVASDQPCRVRKQVIRFGIDDID